MALHQRMSADPAQFADAYYDEATELSPAQLEEMQLVCAQRRLSQLRGKVRVLDRVAEEQGIRELSRLDDLARLLFPHTVYKSYPLEWLETGRFDRMTRWLGGLTSIDLSHVDCEGITTIDDWIQHLDRQTELLVLHTFGTSGKLSFIPRASNEWRTAAHIYAACLRDWHGRESGPYLLTSHLPAIHPSYRFGAGAIQRGVASAVERYAGGDDNCLFLYPNTRFSADVASLAGRLRAADLRGEAADFQLSPHLRARYEESVQRERTRERDLQRFFDEMIQRFAGRNIYLLCVCPVLYDWANTGLKSGLRNMFGPGSVLHTGGGTKGRNLPDNWREQVYEFLGFQRHFDFYAMSELVCGCPQCSHGNYHLPPVIAAFLLHPQTGELLPRTGRVRGRLGCFDLIAESSWGGVVTGDEVTISWDQTCACGRAGPHIEPDIRRFSTAEGGSDKISCAGSYDAYERAVDFLLGTAGAAA